MAEKKQDVKQEKKKLELVKLPDLNQNFSEVVKRKDTETVLAFRFTISNLDRLLHMYKFAKDDKSTDLQIFYHSNSMVFLKDQLDASKAGAVPVELVEGDKEDAEYTLFNLDYALLTQVQSTMKQIEKDSLILKIQGDNSINYLIGGFNLPGKLKDTTLEIPYSKMDESELSVVTPPSELRKILDISYNSLDKKHSALDNIYITPDFVVGGTRGLLFRTDTMLKGLEKTIGFNYKYYQDIDAFKSLVTGEISISLGKSVIRGHEVEVMEFSSYDLRLTIPLANLTEGDVALLDKLINELDTSGSADDIQIHCTVKALTRSLNCMELALYNLKTVHKSTVEVDGSKVVISTVPMTNDVATDTLSCNVKNGGKSVINLGNSYLFDSLRSFDADENIVISIPATENVPRIKLHGKNKSGVEKSWVLSTYEG